MKCNNQDLSCVRFDAKEKFAIKKIPFFLNPKKFSGLKLCCSFGLKDFNSKVFWLKSGGSEATHIPIPPVNFGTGVRRFSGRRSGGQLLATK